MSSDPTQPVPEWWLQPQGPKTKQGNQGDQDYQGPQGNQGDQGHQGPQGNQSDQSYQRTQGYQGYQGFQNPQGPQGFAASQGYQGAQETERLPTSQGYQGSQDYPGSQGYQGPPGAQGFPVNQGYPEAQGYQGPPPRMRRRRRRWPYITVIVIILVLLGADRAANAYTEDQMASQVQSSLALSGKPHVTIQGFPFLTQLAARDFKTVDINASNETAGPGGQLEIANLSATLHGMHIHGLKSATIDQFNATALITFTALGNAGGIPQGITLSADGPNRIKATVDLGPLSGTATVQVTQTGPGKIHVHLIDAGGLPTDALGSLVDFTVSIPKLPAGVSIQSVSVTQQGVQITASGHNTTLSQ